MSALKLVASSNAPAIFVTLLTSQVGIAPYSLSLHKPSTGFVLKQLFIAVRKLASVIGVWAYPNIEMNTSKSVRIFFI